MSNPFLISKEEKRVILEKMEEQVKTNIIAWELNIRHGERLKISAKAGDLGALEEGVRNAKNTKEELEKKMELIEDMLKEVK